MNVFQAINTEQDVTSSKSNPAPSTIQKTSNQNNLIQKSWGLLFPQKPLTHKTILKYSGQFSDYNANIRLTPSKIELRLCKKWQGVSEEIIIGLIQSLLLKVHKKKRSTIYIDLYNSFVKNLHIAIPKENIDPHLRDSFDRVNEQYFANTLEIPNLVWGTHSTRKLGSYDYKKDTISMSTIFKEANTILLDYVMYHEMLHKKHKFSSKNNRNLFHSHQFKKEEQQFENAQELEKQLSLLAHTHRKRSKIPKRATSKRQSFLSRLLKIRRKYL